MVIITVTISRIPIFTHVHSTFSVRFRIEQVYMGRSDWITGYIFQDFHGGKMVGFLRSYSVVSTCRGRYIQR